MKLITPAQKSAQPFPEVAIPGTQMTVQCMTISPTMAADILATKNNKNRPLNEKRAKKLARSHTMGNWKTTYQGLAYDVNGELADGQTRLRACVLSGCHVTMLVFRNVPLDHFEVIDSGNSRSSSDVFGIKGEKNTSTLASACMWMWLYDNAKMGEKSGASFGELQDTLDNNAGLRDSVQEVKRMNKNRSVPSLGLFAMLHYRTKVMYPDKIDFFDKLLTKVGIEDSTSVLTLHKKLSYGKREAKPPMISVAAWTIKAIVSYAKGEFIRVLRFDENEPFPYLL